MNSRSTLLLEHHLKELKLPSFFREYGKMAAQCAAEGVDHPGYLLRLAELELIDRHQRMVERRIRAARFPTVKSLDTFDFTAIPSVNKALVMELARCEYVQNRENIIAVGNSGTGKTHIALGLGLAACQRGMSVGFTTAAALVHELMEARDERRLLSLQRQLSRLSLLIIDELGFVPLSPTGAELLFEVFSQRYERGSILVTTNLPFDEWTEVFGSERLTGALLDRLTHHVHILEMNGESYRLKHNRENAVSQAPDDTGDGYVAPETSSSCPVSYTPVCVTFPLNNCHGHCIFGCMGKAHDDLVAGVGQPVQGAIPQDGVVEEAEPLPHGPVAGDDEAGDPVPADDQVPKPFLSDEGFKKLLEQCSSDTLAGSRRIAILMVLFTTGMRRRELWLLQTGDVDWKQGRINILHGKGGSCGCSRPGTWTGSKAGSTSSTGKAGTPGK